MGGGTVCLEQRGGIRYSGEAGGGGGGSVLTPRGRVEVQ